MTFSGTITSDFMKLADMPVSKRPTLVNFAATDFLTLRDSLLKYARAVYPNDYQYFVESDLGMMFIELVAYMGSVLSMKADMLANENFLATARQRSSVKKLLNMIGVRMKGPLASAAEARLTFNTTYASYVAGQQVTIPADKRTITVNSEVDGGPLTFTLYKVVNGLVDLANQTGNIVLEPFSEAVGANKNVFQNLVLQEGTLVTESGSFIATESIKTIRLNRNSVIDGSVQVYITDPNKATATGYYEQVDNLYFASGSNDKIFQVNYDDDYNATVVFGDGIVGTNPSTEASYFVQYRVGGGVRGNIPKSLINTSVDIGGISVTITNTSPATGGSNAETIEHAKRYAPLTFRRQDRLVTLVDYSTFANAFISKFGSVGKATAVTRKAYSSANVIDIYILEKVSDLQLQRATTNFKTELLTAMNKKKMATDDIVIVDGLIRTIDLILTARIDRELSEFQEDIKTKIRDKVLEYMNVDNRDFGQDLIISELNRKIFEIDEVRFSTIDNLNQDVKIDFNEIIQLNNLTINIELLD
jgi:hypothetical protein